MDPDGDPNFPHLAPVNERDLFESDSDRSSASNANTDTSSSICCFDENCDCHCGK